MRKKVIRNIRIAHIKSLIGTTLISILPNGSVVQWIMGNRESTSIVQKIIFLLIAIAIDLFIIHTIRIIINPLKSDVFKKYGNLDRVAEIFKEIEATKIYEDKHMIISENYIIDKKDFEYLTAFDDILSVHKLVHSRNFSIDYYQIVIKDKYSNKITYKYEAYEDEKVDELILLIGSKSKNAKLGYTDEATKHVRENRVELPKEENSALYCPVCGSEVHFRDKTCKSCEYELDFS